MNRYLVLVTSVTPLEALAIAGDFNGHVSPHSQDFSRYHCKYYYGTRNRERVRVLDLCGATDLI